MQNLTTHISMQLKALRLAKGWSLDYTAKQTGISKAMLGQIERAESNPTVLTMWKISMGFQMPLSHFLPTQNDVSIELKHQDEALSVRILEPFNLIFGSENLYVTLKSNTQHNSCSHESGVMEDVLPINGSLKILINDETYTVHKGQSFRFKADQSHSYINENPFDVEFYNIVHYKK